MIVLDTNVLSELMRAEPAEPVVRWMAAQPGEVLYTTTIAQAEILYGVMLLPAGKRRGAFEAAVDAMFSEDFAGRILPFGGAAALSYAHIASSRQRAGNPISSFDAQIAAITHSAGASLATRNVKDFAHCGIEVVDPWKP